MTSTREFSIKRGIHASEVQLACAVCALAVLLGALALFGALNPDVVGQIILAVGMILTIVPSVLMVSRTLLKRKEVDAQSHSPQAAAVALLETALRLPSNSTREDLQRVLQQAQERASASLTKDGRG